MKNTEKYLLATTLLILPLGLGCQTSRNDAITVETPTVETPQDAALSKSVQERLRADKKVDLTRIKVISSNGTVYLIGQSILISYCLQLKNLLKIKLNSHRIIFYFFIGCLIRFVVKNCFW